MREMASIERWLPIANRRAYPISEKLSWNGVTTLIPNSTGASGL
jgi:hypothetical protein